MVDLVRVEATLDLTGAETVLEVKGILRALDTSLWWGGQADKEVMKELGPMGRLEGPLWNLLTLLEDLWIQLLDLPAAPSSLSVL